MNIVNINLNVAIAFGVLIIGFLLVYIAFFKEDMVSKKK
jgi:hypothetical protein